MDASDEIFLDAEIRPNRSLSPAGFRSLVFVLVSLSLAASVPFMVVGAWPVAGFLGIDVLALYWAFRISYRQGRAVEYIRVTRRNLEIARINSRGWRWKIEMPSYWARVQIDTRSRDENRIVVRSAGREESVGGMLSPDERVGLALALQSALGKARESYSHCDDSPSTSVIS